ncbi:endonuclease/exonuclease/phosphatase family protein [Mucilaginibacter sp. HD30]
MRKKIKKRPAQKLTLLDKIFLGLNILASISLLLSYMAPDTNPRDNSYIAVLGFLYQLLLLSNFLLLIFWLFKKPVFCLIPAVVIILGYNTFLTYFQFNKEETNVKNDSIKILSYNVRGFKGIDKYENLATQKQVLELVGGVNPNILVFEEFLTDKYDNDSTVLLIKKNLKYNYSFVTNFNDTVSDKLSGNAIFSKLPIIDTGRITAPEVLQTRCIFADIKNHNTVIRVYSVHMAAVTFQSHSNQLKSKYLKGNVSAGSSTFVLRKLASAFIARSLQVSYIKKHIEKCPYPYIIVGDFNDTPNSYSVNEIGSGLQNAFMEKGSGFETTYYSAYPLHIDHIFATKDFDILSYQSIDKKISDHKPVIATMRLNNQ